MPLCKSKIVQQSTDFTSSISTDTDEVKFPDFYTSGHAVDSNKTAKI